MRVFVLGAGASLHGGYPLAADMGHCLAEWIKTLPTGHQYRFSFQQIVDAYGDLDNFEAILADLMTCPPGSPAASLGQARHHLIGDIQEAIRDLFDAIRAAATPLYDDLTRVLCPGDTIITFNYDLGVERALMAAGLWDVRIGYGFPIEDAETRSPVEVLKLHGSTNWRALLFGDADSLGYRPVLLFEPDLAYIGCPDFVDPRRRQIKTAASVPAMIMPALPKQFHFKTTFGVEWKNFWDDLWCRAARAIANAHELVVIGYSLPTADERARTMLLESVNKTVRLSICCGSSTMSLEQEFRSHEFIGIQNVAPTFEGFLKRD